MKLKPRFSKSFAAFTALMLSVVSLAAEENNGFGVGLFSSPKGFGPCFEFKAGNSLVCDAYLIADTYDVLFNKAVKPGVRASFCFNANLQEWQLEHCDIELFAGPGLFGGYGFDASRSMGFYCALCADGGVRFKLRPDITVLVSLEIGAGLHLSKDNSQSFNKLHMYKYGIYNSWIPQISILYRF